MALSSYTLNVSRTSITAFSFFKITLSLSKSSTQSYPYFSQNKFQNSYPHIATSCLPVSPFCPLQFAQNYAAHLYHCSSLLSYSAIMTEFLLNYFKILFIIYKVFHCFSSHLSYTIHSLYIILLLT